MPKAGAEPCRPGLCETFVNLPGSYCTAVERGGASQSWLSMMRARPGVVALRVRSALTTGQPLLAAALAAPGCLA